MTGKTPSTDPVWTLQALIEDLALKAEDLGKSLEGVQGLAEEIALGSRIGIHPDSLMRLQVLDSLTQRLFVLPGLLRCLKAAVPEELTMHDVELLRSFEAIMNAYQGTLTSGPTERLTASGDCDLWDS